jgi:hypothetical protein
VITVLVITINEDSDCDGDHNGGLPNDGDGAEYDNIDADGDDGRDRTTMTKVTTRITTTMMRLTTTPMLPPMLTTMVIETMVKTSPRCRRRK